MAVFNEILAGRFNRALQKLFGMKGPPPVPQLGSEILAVQNLPFGVEHRFLLSENRFGTTINITGAAGQFSKFRLRNPQNSGIIGIIEQLIITNATAAAQIYNQNQTSVQVGDLTTTVGNIRLDSRITQTGSGLINTTTITDAIAVAPNTGQYSLAAGTCFSIIATENQEITIAPGDSWTIGHNAAASTLIVSLIWRERPLEESERAITS